MKSEASPRRRGGGGGDGSPRELVEPSKVLHVRNVGYPVLQASFNTYNNRVSTTQMVELAADVFEKV